jgi:hypothetical protein
MLALGYLGLHKESLAQQEFANILQIDSNHLGALCHRNLCGMDAPPVVYKSSRR